MAQLDEYCWGGNMDWSGAGDTSKLDFSCMLEPETHKLLKVLSSYGVEGTVTTILDCPSCLAAACT